MAGLSEGLERYGIHKRASSSPSTPRRNRGIRRDTRDSDTSDQSDPDIRTPTDDQSAERAYWTEEDGDEDPSLQPDGRYRSSVQKKKHVTMSSEKKTGVRSTGEREDAVPMKRRLRRKEEEAQQFVITNRMAISFVMLLVALLLGCYLWQHNGTAGVSNRLDVLRRHLQLLKQSYTGQPEHVWQIIRSSAVEVLNSSDAHRSPAVLLMVASSHNENFTNCLSRKVAQALSHAFDDGGSYGEIKLEELTFTEDVVAAKHIVEARCKTTLVEKGQHVILAPHIESWHPDLAMMLHPLCDYDNPQYKNAAFVLTAFTSDIVADKSRNEYDRVAEDILNKAWDVMDTNQRHAIISRVTVNVAVVRDGVESCS